MDVFCSLLKSLQTLISLTSCLLCKKKNCYVYKKNMNSWQIKLLSAGMPFLNAYFVNSKYTICARRIFFFLEYRNIVCAILRKKTSTKGFRLPAINCCAFSTLGIQIKDLITRG